MNYYNIINEEDKNKYKFLVTDTHIQTDYRNIILLFTDSNILKRTLENINKNNVEYKATFSTVNKILLIRELEQAAGIGILNINFKLNEDPIEINNKLLKNIQTAFRTTTKAPSNTTEFYKFYMSKLLNICGNIKLFNSKQIQVNKERIYKYSINEDVMKLYFDLQYLKYPTRFNINKDLLERYKNLIKIDDVEQVLFLDDDDEPYIEEKLEEGWNNPLNYKPDKEENNKIIYCCRICKITNDKQQFFNEIFCCSCATGW